LQLSLQYLRDITEENTWHKSTVLEPRGEISAKSDIYSLGILILEIVTGKKNHKSKRQVR
ncbi:hypothetical protein BAE44_0024083, partial [Dichanthelium oligosanthes]